MKQILVEWKGEIDKTTVTVEDFTTPLLIMGSKTEDQKRENLNDSINQLDITDIYRPLHPTTAEDTFLSSRYGTFFRINQIVHHKKVSIYLKKLKPYKVSFLTGMK